MQEKSLIIRQISQGFNDKSWHGTNLNGSIRGLKPELAAWRPGPDRHNIWELIVHCAYWKYIVIRRVSGESKGSFALKGSNFFERNAGSISELRSDMKLLKDYHKRLLATVESLKPGELGHIPKGSSMSNRDMLIGVAAHDIYHAGQIQLIKRLYEQR